MDVISAFNAQIASSPPILEAIFQNLSCIDLNLCAQVCKAWESKATSVKKRRLPELSYCILQYHDGKNYWEDNFSRHLQNLTFEPHFVLTFVMDPRFCLQIGGNELYSTVYYDKPDWNMIRSGNANLTQHLPPSCTQLFCSPCYFPTAPIPMKYMLSNHEESGDLAAVFFPTIPGFQVHVAEIRESHFTCSDKAIIPEKTKLTLILYNKNGPADGNMQDLEFLLINMRSKRNQELAMGGALIANVDYSISNSRILEGLYVLSFIGDNVHAASIIIPPNMQTADSIEQKLKGLFDTQVFEGQCIAFAFTCVIRSLCYLKSKGVEYDVFRKLFPFVPLFVVIGEKAVGIDYIPNVMKPNGSTDSFFHRNSTVFVVLSVRK